MSGTKITLVKESLKILVEMMDKNDHLALILFEDKLLSCLIQIILMIKQKKIYYKK